MADKKRKALKVNIGCGPIGKDDWVNIDYGVLAILYKYDLIPVLEKLLTLVSYFRKDLAEAFSPYLKMKWPKNLLIHNCLKGLPFKKGEVDYIFASHFLEHLKYYETLPFLKEVRRVLKTDGLVRISVPDLDLLIEKHKTNDQKFFRKHTYPGGDNDYSLSKTVLRGDALVSFFFPYYNWKKRSKIVEIVFKTFVRPHLWMYDFDSLVDLLKRAGFKKIKRCQYRLGEMPDLDKLDAHPQESLYVEARK